MSSLSSQSWIATSRALVQNFIVAIVAYLLGYQFTATIHLGTAEIGGMWSVISGVFVMADSQSHAIKTAMSRIRSSLVGCLISGVYLYFFSFSMLGFASCIVIGVLLCHLLRVPEDIKTVSITICVVIIVSVIIDNINPAMNASLRFVESVIGSLVAMVVAAVGLYITHIMTKTT